MQLYNVLVADSHKLFTEGFCELLRKKIKNFATINPCYSLDVAKKELNTREYNYLFTDAGIHNNDSKEFITYCRRYHKDIIIIVVATSNDLSEIKVLLSIGINAYLSKSAGSDELQTAIEKTRAGEKYISVEQAGKLAASIYVKNDNNLTKKELEVLRLVAKGLTISEAAELMHLSQHTIIGHRRNIMQKLGVHSATAIVKYAYENNLF